MLNSRVSQAGFFLLIHYITRFIVDHFLPLEDAGISGKMLKCPPGDA